MPRPTLSTWTALPCLAVICLAPLGCDGGEDLRIDRVEVIEQAAVVNATTRGGSPITWIAPDNWRRLDEQVPMRYATFVAGEGDIRVEIVVSSLEGNAGGVELNIDRWRGQLNLPPMQEAQALADTWKPLEFDDGRRGLWLDLVGTQDDAPMRMIAVILPDLAGNRTWFVKSTAPPDAIKPHVDAIDRFVTSINFHGVDPHAGHNHPPGEHPADDHAGHNHPPGEHPADPHAGHNHPPGEHPADVHAGHDQVPRVPVWDSVPQDWHSDANTGTFATAAFSIGDDQAGARLTITPLAHQGADLLANINRWRGQVGKPSIDRLEDASAWQVTVDGAPAIFIDLSSDGAASADFERMLMVVLPTPQRSWIFKMAGDDAVVGPQREPFMQWIASIKLAGGDT